MISSFEDVWLAIAGKVHAGEEIKNWGGAHGYTGRTFKIEEVSNSWIRVFGERMTESRMVSKGDFGKIYAVWDQYISGNYPRGRLRFLSQNLTYILSIFRHIIGE